MENKRKYLLGGLILLVFLLLVGTVWFFRMRHVLRTAYPLVQIYRPFNNARLVLGEGTIVHATARASNGVERIELWVDGALVMENESPEDDALSPLVLSASWEPAILGKHEFIVRAVSAEGVEGQATIYIKVIDDGAAFAETSHLVSEGETLESIAADYELEVEDLLNFNPDVDPDDLAEGDSLNLPSGGFPDSPEVPVGQPSEGEAPDSHNAHPGSPRDVLEQVGLDPYRAIPRDEGLDEGGTPGILGLRIEALALETSLALAQLHCYASIADLPPAWYPDTDGDQTTDESFAALAPDAWDIASHLSGDSSLFIEWPQDDLLPIEITCVGIRDGGTDSVDLGLLELLIPPRNWDGITRWSHAWGDDGNFTLHYRVTWETGARAPIQGYEDPEMTVPINVEVHNDARLTWEYLPDEDAPIISGFQILFNDILMWSVLERDTRHVLIPETWLHPPCGEEYRFSVRSYIYSGDRWSYPSDPARVTTGNPGDPGCASEFVVTFMTLETFDLGGDGRYDPGDVGPVYGHFYANDDSGFFDGRPDERFSLNNYSEYDIATSMPWNAGSTNQVVVSLEEGDDLRIGYWIKDEDTGIGARGNDDLVCDKWVTFSYEEMMSEPHKEMSIDSFLEPRCRVQFMVHYLGGSPIGTGGDYLPLPWLELVGMQEDPDGLKLQIRNIGTAEWLNDLSVAIEPRRSTFTYHSAWYDLRIGVGETVDLGDPMMGSIRPNEICVTLDDHDMVLELYEYLGTNSHDTICRPLPDLVIESAEHDLETGELTVLISNVSWGSMERYGVDLRLTYDNSTTVDKISQIGEEVTLLPGVSYWMVFEADIDYDILLITVDPLDKVLEEDEENNDFYLH